MEEQIIADIARRIKKTGRLTETAELQAEMLKEQGYSPAHILAEVRKTINKDPAYMAEVAKNTLEYKKMVSETIKQTVKDAEEEGDMLVAKAGMMSYRDDLRIWNEHGVNLKNPNTLSQLVTSYSEQTKGNMRNLTGTTGSMELNGVKLQNAYRHELDLAIIKTVSGGFSFNKALDDCCYELARKGLKVVYPSGKKIGLESAVRMCLKTGISQLSGKITEENMKKTKTKLVYVSAHAGARPEHAKWQGKVYTYDGTPTAEYPDFVDSTHYGSVTGLKGVNCSHEFYPHWEGDPIPVYIEPKSITFQGKEYTFYEATQEQRKMERRARELQREIEAQKAINNADKVRELYALKNKNLNRYLDFSAVSGLNPKLSRMNIYEKQSELIMRKIGKFSPASDIATGLPDFMQKIIYKKQMIELDKKLDSICKRETNWKRILYIKDIENLGESNEEGEITLRPNSALCTRYHELLHERSIFCFTDKEYVGCSKMEEGIVDWLADELAKKDGAKDSVITYVEEVNALKSIVNHCNIDNEDNKFLIRLFNEKPQERRNTIGEEVRNAIESKRVSNDIAIELMNCLDKLQGDIDV